MNHRLDLEDVYDPLPWGMVLGLATAVTAGSWIVFDWAARLSVELLASQVTTHSMQVASWAAGGLAILGGLAGLAAFLWRDQTGLVAERTDTHVRIVTRTRVSSHAIEVPLADLRSLRLEGAQLILQTTAGERRVSLPGRSQEAHDAIEAFISAV